MSYRMCTFAGDRLVSGNSEHFFKAYIKITGVPVWGTPIKLN